MGRGELQAVQHFTLAVAGLLFLFTQTATAEILPRKSVTSDSLKFDQEAASATSPSPQNDAAPELKAQRLVPLAFGSDGFPKIRKYYKGKDESRTLEKVENDFNGDGRVDFIQWYDPSGQFVERESADLDGNGRMNVTSHFKMIIGQSKRELILQEFDAKFEGKTSVWKHFKNSVLIRREIDRKGLGRPDYWEYYDDAKLVKIEKDENADGVPDLQPMFKPVVKPQSPEPIKTKAPTQVR
jgi:hypothetical protein